MYKLSQRTQMPTFRASGETMELLRMLRAWTELSNPGKKYSLDSALLEALKGMNLPLELSEKRDKLISLESSRVSGKKRS